MMIDLIELFLMAFVVSIAAGIAFIIMYILLYVVLYLITPKHNDDYILDNFTQEELDKFSAKLDKMTEEYGEINKEKKE